MKQYTKRPREYVFNALKYLVMAFVVISATFPTLWVIVSSFKTQQQIFSGGLTLPTSLNLKAYAFAINMSPVLDYFGNSIIISVCATLLNAFLMGMAAYVMARHNFKGKGLLTLLFYSTLLLASQAISYPIFMTIRTLHLLNTKAGLIFVYTALGLPTTLFILRSYFLTIPRELDEAAEIDGAGFLRTYFQIMLPIAKPGLATAATLQFLFCWNEFYFALMLTTGDSARTVPLTYSYFTAAFSSNYPAMFAAIALTTLPSILMYMLLQEQVVGGLAAGAVKI